MRHRQQLGLTRLELALGARQTLALRTMSVAAGVVGAANQPAVAALLDVPSERRRSAYSSIAAMTRRSILPR